MGGSGGGRREGDEDREFVWCATAKGGGIVGIGRRRRCKWCAWWAPDARVMLAVVWR